MGALAGDLIRKGLFRKQCGKGFAEREHKFLLLAILTTFAPVTLCANIYSVYMFPRILAQTLQHRCYYLHFTEDEIGT